MGPVLSTGRVAGRRSAASRDRRHLSEGPTASQGRNPETQGAWLRQPLERHVEQRWSKDCVGILLRFRGLYAYVDALPASGTTGGLEADEPKETRSNSAPTLP